MRDPDNPASNQTRALDAIPRCPQEPPYASSRRGSPLKYRLTCFVLRHPGLLRWIGALLRRFPSIARFFPAVARRDALDAVMRRPASFSNSSHAPTLVAGPFVIGMDAGPRHDRERRIAENLLRSPAEFGAASRDATRAAVARIEQAGTAFDLVDDFAVGVVWNTLCGGLRFGHALGEGDPTLYSALRHVGAHLIVGGMAPDDIQQRAENDGDYLYKRTRARLLAIEEATAASVPLAVLLRNAIGLQWVGHPATVQAIAILMRELLARPDLYTRLANDAGTLGTRAYDDPDFRARLRDHIHELLRFRPVFPLLARDVPRDTLFEAGTRCPLRAKAGAKMTLLMIGALFDPAATDNPDEYHAPREWVEPGDRDMQFGHGARPCIARAHVMEALISAVTGLLLMPRLRYAEPWWQRRIVFDGPAVARMRLCFERRT